MILSDTTLRAMLASGELGVDPLEDGQIQPASIDVRLGAHFSQANENRLHVIRLDAEIVRHCPGGGLAVVVEAEGSDAVVDPE